MKKNKTVLLVLLLLIFLIADEATTAGNEKIIFLHHSTGNGVWSGGNVAGWFTSYNTQHGTTYQAFERSYPNDPYDWQNYPYDYWHLWVDGHCNSAESGIECMNTLTQNFNVIIYKHCFPGADVLADTGSPDIRSDRKSIENYRLQYRALRSMMDAYPNNIFMVWTLAPLHRLDTSAANAARAKQFVDWVKTDFLTEDGKTHPNIFIFDFWGQVAGADNFLRYNYEISHTGSDSHPNALANQTVGPIFAQSIIDSINNFSPAPDDTTPPAAPTGLTVD